MRRIAPAIPPRFYRIRRNPRNERPRIAIISYQSSGGAAHLRGDEDVGVDAELAEAAQGVEAALGLRGRAVGLLGGRVGRLLGGLERLHQLPLHGHPAGGGGDQNPRRKQRPRRRGLPSSVSGSEALRRGEEEKRVGFGGSAGIYTARGRRRR